MVFVYFFLHFLEDFLVFLDFVMNFPNDDNDNRLFLVVTMCLFVALSLA